MRAAIARPAGAIGLLCVLILAALPAASTMSSAPARRPARFKHGSVGVVQTTADLSQRLTRLADGRFSSDPVRRTPVIRVDDRVRYQRIRGFGAAMTDSAAWLLHARLAPAARDSVMRRLFGASGIRLGFLRLPMGASDFTVDGTPYSYDAAAGGPDPRLARFSVAHDDAYIVPALRQVLWLSPRVEILASPWSPPGWMKSNAALDNGGGAATLLPSARAPLASYFVRFLQAYQRRGIRVDAITPQNEPGQRSAYPGLTWPQPEAARWIARNLAPALRSAGLRTRIYGHDFNWAGYADARALISRPEVARVIAGVAWHCYVGNPRAMAKLHRAAPRIEQIVTECSTGISPGPAAELVIASLRNWATAVALWNLALDPTGGPVQAPNDGCRGCTGVVTVDARSGAVHYLRDYYQLGQASSFIRRGARRIGSNTFVTYNSTMLDRGPSYATAGLDDVAFENPDASKVLLVHNNASTTKRFAVAWKGRSLRHALAAGATVTFVWDRR